MNVFIFVSLTRADSMFLFIMRGYTLHVVFDYENTRIIYIYFYVRI